MRRTRESSSEARRRKSTGPRMPGGVASTPKLATPKNAGPIVHRFHAAGIECAMFKMPEASVRSPPSAKFVGGGSGVASPHGRGKYTSKKSGIFHAAPSTISGRALKSRSKGRPVASRLRSFPHHRPASPQPISPLIMRWLLGRPEQRFFKSKLEDPLYLREHSKHFKDLQLDREFCGFEVVTYQDPATPRADVLQGPIQETTIICHFDASRFPRAPPGAWVRSGFWFSISGFFKLQAPLEHSTVNIVLPPFQTFGGLIP
ncbi:hypothetical protein DFH09DRAFT_1446478 [Mycena vulgaris]|nr:hypothetical protein DFH09DRAFT_1446478 [Mycena vulgaris]